jgi:RNA polymerase primary sigma factor
MSLGAFPSETSNRDGIVMVGAEKKNQFRSLNQEEWLKVVEDLLDGRDYITTDELLSLLPEAEEHLDLLDDLLYELALRGISVLESDEEGEDVRIVQEVLEEPSAKRSASALADLESVPADDLLSLYFTEMAQEPLLTYDEEVELARQIEMGRQAEQALAETDGTADEYKRLRAKMDAGQAAREHLGRANTRLVVSIAKRYRGSGVPFSDLIQNGNIGLMRAVDRYDYRTGNRFSTYATWWIRQAVTRSLANQGRIIRIPVHTGGRMRKMFKIAQRLEMEQGRRPTPKEIADEMDESPTKIRQMMRWAPRPLSLETPVGEERDVELGDFIEDQDIVPPEELADVHLLNETLEELLSKLAPREARVLRLRYGLQDGQTRTLKEIAEKFGLSRERIRQIEQEALTKLRMVAPDYRLQHFLEEG